MDKIKNSYPYETKNYNPIIFGRAMHGRWA